jgi:hypothetical protein
VSDKWQKYGVTLHGEGTVVARRFLTGWNDQPVNEDDAMSHALREERRLCIKDSYPDIYVDMEAWDGPRPAWL